MQARVSPSTSEPTIFLMSNTTRPPLSDDDKQEFGQLLLLDRLMQYENALADDREVAATTSELEAQEKPLKGKFFRSDEEDYELEQIQQDLIEARQARKETTQELKDAEPNHLSIALIEQDESGLEPFLKHMEQRGVIHVDEQNCFASTEQGDKVYEQLVEQLDSYVTHFDVYAYVDLEEGGFADPETDLLEDNRWSDLRVAVAEHKGVDPYRVVFLAMLSAEVFFENPEWRFDLAVGSLFDELEATVQDQIAVEELGYEDDEGEVSGEDVIADIIEQGSVLAKERFQARQEAEEQAVMPDEQVITTTYYW